MSTSGQATRDLLIREATALDAQALAAVQVRSWRAAYRGIIDDAYLDALSVQRRRDGLLAWFRDHPSSSFARVAVDGDARIVGFAMGGEARTGRRPMLGEVYVIYLLPESQRQGVGTRLMRSMARGFDLRGMDSLVIWVLQRNPARAFYERLGGRPGATRPTSVGRQSLGEVAYSWDELAPLGVASAA
jgi:ribosomal protein S18 acetylase RimI-like enzyme